MGPRRVRPVANFGPPRNCGSVVYLLLELWRPGCRPLGPIRRGARCPTAFCTGSWAALQRLALHSHTHRRHARAHPRRLAATPDMQSVRNRNPLALGNKGAGCRHTHPNCNTTGCPNHQPSRLSWVRGCAKLVAAQGRQTSANTRAKQKQCTQTSIERNATMPYRASGPA